MEILLVAATEMETRMLRLKGQWKEVAVNRWRTQINNHTVELVVTGIGMVNTALAMGAYLAQKKPGLAVNFGIAGTFEEEISIGEVVEVRTEVYGDLGAETPEGFLDLEEMGFPLYQDKSGPVYNQLDSPWDSLSDLRKVRGLTVNKVHGRTESIHEVRDKWDPDIESMEGAAFFQACLQGDIRFAQVRSISNRVEARDTSKWEIPLAVRNVQEWISGWLNDLP